MNTPALTPATIDNSIKTSRHNGGNKRDLVFMFRLTSLVIFFTFVFILVCIDGCSNTVKPSVLSVIVKLDTNNAIDFPKVAKKAVLNVTSADMASISKVFPNSDSIIQFAIYDIPAGIDRLFSISLYDSNNMLKYTGFTKAKIFPDSTVYVNIVIYNLCKYFIEGYLLKTDNSPATNCKVWLLPSDYDPIKSRVPLYPDADTTDKDGHYFFKAKDTGMYSLNAVGLLDRQRLLISRVHVFKDTTIIPTSIINQTGVIKIIISVPNINPYGFFYVPGTFIASPLYKDSLTIILDSIPPCIIPSVNYSTLPSDTTSRVIKDSILVTSGDTSVILMAQ